MTCREFSALGRIGFTSPSTYFYLFFCLQTRQLPHTTTLNRTQMWTYLLNILLTSPVVISYILLMSLGFPGGASDKEPACQCRRCKRCSFHPRVGKMPWRRVWQPTAVFLPGKSHGQRSLAGYCPQYGSQRVRYDLTDIAHLNALMSPQAGHSLRFGLIHEGRQHGW